MSGLETLLRGARIAALTGAGCSTESGIPDYRGEGARPRTPIQHQEFVRDESTRRRYWARSTIGWRRIAEARPNAAHRALAELEAGGHLTGLVTQNVDGLHQKAGSHDVLELHGSLAAVRCLGCDRTARRDAVQRRLVELNPALGEATATPTPDGDAEVAADVVDGFVVPACDACGGVLKPDVVFFGGSVPKARVDAAFSMVDAADVLLVVGSSLAVFSGYRFVLRARDRGIPIAIVNRGPTRADAMATLHVDELAGEVLPAVVQALVG